MDPQTYFQNLLNEWNFGEDYEDAEGVIPRRRYVAIFVDNSESNGYFLQTFDSEADLTEYINGERVYDDTNTRGEVETNWQVFQVHDTERLTPMRFRTVFQLLGPVERPVTS